MKRWLPLLLLALLCSGAVAFLILHDEDIPDTERLLGDHDPGQVTELRLYGPGGENVLLRRREGTWGVAAENDYPADEERLYDLLLSLGELRLTERKTARAENHPLLGLTAPGEEDAQAIRFVLRGEGGVIADFLLGDDASSREGAYLRYTEDPQSWLVTPGLEKPPLDPWLWLRQPLLAIEDTDLEELRFRTGGREYRLQNRDGELQPAPDSGFALIEGESLPDYKLALEEFRFEEVWPRDAEDIPAGERPYQATVACCGGLQIGLEFTPLAEGALLRLSASGQGELAARAEDFNRRHEAWVYQVEDQVAEIFAFTPEDYLEPRAVKQESEDGDKNGNQEPVPRIELRP